MRYDASPRVMGAWAVGIFVMLLAVVAAAQDEPSRDEGSSAPQAQSEGKGQYYQERSAYGPIQSRKFKMKHELSLGWAYLPLDAYYKGYGLQLAYTIHLSPIVAIELFRIGWSYDVDTSLKKKVLTMPGADRNQFPAVVFFENTNLVLNVLYGKHSFLNRTVVHFELFITAGAAFIYRNPFNVNALEKRYGLYDIGLNGGFGFRVWIDPTWSVRVDIRDTVTLLSIKNSLHLGSSLKESLMIGLMLSVNL